MENNVIINADFRSKEIIVAEIKTVISNIQETAFFGAIRIGQGLKELKKLVPHGELAGYINESLGFSQRKFQQYIQFADQYGDENTTYFKAVSNAKGFEELSFTNALKLLAVPEDKIEGFVDENEVSDITTKELDKRIKELQSEKDRVKELQTKLNNAIDERDAYSKRENALVEQINVLQEGMKNGSASSDDSKSAISKTTKEIEKAQKEKESAEARAEKLQKQIDQFKADQAKTIENEKKKAQDEARRASEEEIKKLSEANATAIKEKQEVKMELKFKEDLVSFKIIVDNYQEYFNHAVSLLSTIKKNDAEQAETLRIALKTILSEMEKTL